jgi:hypothetical protein
MIFAHSIIPHNHIENDISSRSGEMHSYVHNHDGCGLSREFHSQCEDISACHISNFLYHQFNQDNIIIQTSKDTSISSDFLPGQIIFGTDQHFFSDSCFGTASLRAPPVS